VTGSGRGLIYRLVTGHRRTTANVEPGVHVVELDVAATRLATDLVLALPELATGEIFRH
jgi:hypothetical protein